MAAHMEQATLLILLVGFFLSIWAKYAEHDVMRHHDGFEFQKMGAAPSKHQHSLVFRIKPLNLDILAREINERSSPRNGRYQNWMSFDEVTELTANREGAELLEQWLVSSGTTVEMRTIQDDYIVAVADVGKWEQMLQTSFYVYSASLPSGNIKGGYIRADRYSLPEHISLHVEAVFNTVQTPLWNHLSRTAKEATSISKFEGLSGGYTGLSTVAWLRTLYGVPSDREGNASSMSTQGVLEFSFERFSIDDLHAFQEYYDLPQSDPITVNDVSVNQSRCANDTTIDCGEANLDLQYIMGLSEYTTTYYWYIETPTSDGFVEFLVAISNTTAPPLVNSISWGIPELFVPHSYQDAFNTAAMKLAAIGVTILVASGDDGAVYDSYCGYFPSFPASCPYVTAVGATQGSNGLAPKSTDDEIVCSSNTGYSGITSGGGFSDYYSTPTWQMDAVNAYFDHLSPAPESGYSTTGRGVPDISFSGIYFPTVVGNQMWYMSGTSASAPTLAAFLSLINTARLGANMTSVGFINPTLYAAQNSEYFNDVIEGDNKCGKTTCCDVGFSAKAGWDPVTGLGSADFLMLQLMLNTSIVSVSSSSKGLTATDKLIIIVVVVVVGGVALITVGVLTYVGFLCSDKNTTVIPAAVPSTDGEAGAAIVPPTAATNA